MKRIVAGFLVTCMLFSVTACGNGSAQSVEVGSAETGSENNESEPAGSELSEGEATTAAPVSGAYTYTVYGDIQLSMDVNVDDYIFTNESNGYTCFRVAQLAYDLGWLGNDEYSEVDNDNESSYRPGCYTFHSDDLVATLKLDSYHAVPRYDDHQCSCGSRFGHYTL